MTLSSLSVVVLGSALLSFWSSSSFAQKCLDNSGNPVDWWLTYKLNDGFNYAYADASTTLQLWSFGLDNNNAALIRTLGNMLDDKSTLNSTQTTFNSSTSSSYFMYNDQPPTGTASSSYGHTKGVVAIGPTDSLWILHSCPHYPSPTSYAFPEKETIYGQTFLCMSIDSSTVNTIAGQFLLTEPYVYANTVPLSVQTKYPNVGLMTNKKWDHTAGTKIAPFMAGSQSMQSAVKNKEWDKDLYEDLIAPTLNSGLVCETWMRGEELGSYCKPKYAYQVTDVTDLEIDGVSWSEKQDHSKWCITVNDDDNYVCICDINRMTSQRSRGGGCVCFENSKLWTGMNGIITAYNKCATSSTFSQNRTRV